MDTANTEVPNHSDAEVEEALLFLKNVYAREAEESARRDEAARLARGEEVLTFLCTEKGTYTPDSTIPLSVELVADILNAAADLSNRQYIAEREQEGQPVSCEDRSCFEKAETGTVERIHRELVQSAGEGKHPTILLDRSFVITVLEKDDELFVTAFLKDDNANEKQGDAHYDAGDYEAALSSYERIAKESGSRLWKIVRTLLRMGKEPEARALVKREMGGKTRPVSANSAFKGFFKLAGILKEMGRDGEAYELLCNATVPLNALLSNYEPLPDTYGGGDTCLVGVTTGEKAWVNTRLLFEHTLHPFATALMTWPVPEDMAAERREAMETLKSVLRKLLEEFVPATWIGKQGPPLLDARTLQALKEIRLSARDRKEEIAARRKEALQDASDDHVSGVWEGLALAGKYRKGDPVELGEELVRAILQAERSGPNARERARAREEGRPVSADDIWEMLPDASVRELLQELLNDNGMKRQVTLDTALVAHVIACEWRSYLWPEEKQRELRAVKEGDFHFSCGEYAAALAAYGKSPTESEETRLKVLRCLFHTDRDEGWKRYAAELSRRSLERGRRPPLHEARFHVRMAGLASEAGMEKEGLLRMAAAARLFEEALSDENPVDIDDPSFVLDDLLPLITTMGAIVPADEDMKRAAADGAASLRTIIMELKERELRRMTG